MRNAIRSMVANQEDLPLALRRDNILRIQQKGDAFRTDLCKRIDDMIGLCRISIELFNKIIKIEAPQHLYELPERIQRHFIPALIRIWREGRVQPFRFNGTAEDSSSITFMKTWYKLENTTGRFNVQGTEFIKRKHRRPGWFELYIKPEIPRHGLRNHEIELKRMSPPDREWRDYYFEFPAEWPQMHKIKVSARGNYRFYFRHWQEGRQGDSRIIKTIKKDLRKSDRARWENVNSRIQDFPACLYAVLCHRGSLPNSPKKKVEWIDAIPQFGVTVNPDVRAGTDGTYDLGTPEPEWMELAPGRPMDFSERAPQIQFNGNQGLRGFKSTMGTQVTNDGRSLTENKGHSWDERGRNQEKVGPMEMEWKDNST